MIRNLLIVMSIGTMFPGSYLFTHGNETFIQQEEPPPDQPHTSDPSKCTRYCYPQGGDPERMKPKNTPEGIEGYECQGVKCGRSLNQGDGTEDLCSEHGNPDNTGRCSSWCARVCCSCLASCV